MKKRTAKRVLSQIITMCLFKMGDENVHAHHRDDKNDEKAAKKEREKTKS